MPVSPTATQFTPKRVRTRSSSTSSAVGVGDEDPPAASRRSWRSPGVMESLTERAAWSARSSTSALRAFATVSGSTRTSWGGRTSRALERHDPCRARGALRGGGRGVGGRAQAGLAQVGGVGEAGGVTAHDPDPGAALAARTRTPRPWRRRGGPRPCDGPRRTPRRSRRHLQGALQRALEDGFVDHGGHPSWLDGRSNRVLRGLSIVGRCRCAPVCPHAVELVVTDDDTALALHTGDVPVLATPRVVRLAEEATVRAVEGHPRRRAPPASDTACSSTTSPRRPVGGRCAPKRRSRPSRDAGSRSASR